MLNEQLTCLTPFSQEDEPGLAWRTEAHEEHEERPCLTNESFVFFVRLYG